MLESADQLALGLITGIVFGFLLQKGQVGSHVSYAMRAGLIHKSEQESTFPWQ